VQRRTPLPPSVPGVWGNCGEVVAGARGDNLPGIVFQHGIWSDACTWGRTKPWVLDRFYFGGRAAISTNSVATYDEQRDQLSKAVTAMNDDRLIFIGHSNGGIVSRRLAQQIASYDPSRLQGVITLGSPHLGAPAMNTGVTLARWTGRALATGFLYLCATNQRGCGEAEMMAGATGVFAKLDNFAFTPLYNEMAPNSPFRSQLNGVTETFKKVGVVSHSQNRFLWARMVGDMRCDPDAECGGREQVHRTKRFQKHLKYTAIIGGLLAIGATIVGQPYIASTAARSALQAGGMYAMLEIFDSIYHAVVSPHDDSDGIVPVTSQRYPHADQLYEIFNADSHVGTTRSGWVQDRIRLALTDTRLFVVARR
jgi:pimeloyl-ACP methyl ester carboxylesterase